MRRFVALAVGVALVLMGLVGSAPADELRLGAMISSQTTTTLLASAAGRSIGIVSGSVCVDPTGATTVIVFQDGNGRNLAGTGVSWTLAPGACFWFPTRSSPYFTLTAAGTSLQVVTSAGNGPVTVSLEVLRF